MRCRRCITKDRETAAVAEYGPEEMRKDTLMADRPRLRLEVERLARTGNQFAFKRAR